MNPEQEQLLKKFKDWHHVYGIDHVPATLDAIFNWFLSNLQGKVVSDEEIRAKAKEWQAANPQNKQRGWLYDAYPFREGYKQALRDMQSTGLQDHSHYNLSQMQGINDGGCDIGKQLEKERNDPGEKTIEEQDHSLADNPAAEGTNIAGCNHYERAEAVFKLFSHAHDPTTNEGGWIRQPDKPQENTESQEELWKEVWNIYWQSDDAYIDVIPKLRCKFEIKRR